MFSVFIYIYIYMCKKYSFFKEITNFIQLALIKLIKSDQGFRKKYEEATIWTLIIIIIIIIIIINVS